MAEDGNAGRKVRRNRRRKAPRRRPAVPVPALLPEAEAAEYVFDLIRSLLGITRDFGRFRLAAWFLEMAALELAPCMRPGAGDDRVINHQDALPADPAGG